MRKTAEEFDMAGTPESTKSTTEGEEMGPQVSRVESIWPAENISFPREALMVFVACMAQFCTRELLSLHFSLLCFMGFEPSPLGC